MQYKIINLNTNDKLGTHESSKTNKLYGPYENMTEWKVNSQFLNKLGQFQILFHPLIIPKGLIKTEQEQILYFHEAILQPVLNALRASFPHLELTFHAEYRETGDVATDGDEETTKEVSGRLDLLIKARDTRIQRAGVPILLYEAKKTGTLKREEWMNGYCGEGSQGELTGNAAVIQPQLRKYQSLLRSTRIVVGDTINLVGLKLASGDLIKANSERTLRPKMFITGLKRRFIHTILGVIMESIREESLT